MEQEDAIEGLKRLGLTTYEARVFIGLQKLGQGTASEVSDVADVPRSQVYGAAEGLGERGLIERQQSTPTVYRPVPLEQARSTLLDQLARTGSETFDYLDDIQETAEQEERTESIWMVSGRDSVTSRTVELTADATEQVLYAVEDIALLTESVLEALESAAARDASVVVASADEAVLSTVPEESSVEVFNVPESRDMDMGTTRFVIVDGETILLSAASTAHSAAADEQAPNGQEVAFWTSETAFAAVLANLAEAWLKEPFA